MRLSVVVPLYNKEISITRAIRSVLSQTHSDFELIIIDDGSTDNSLESVRTFTDHRVRLVSQQNAGVSAARNRGAMAASSDYVCFLDADDEWKPEFLSEIADLVSRCPAASMYSCRFLTVDESGRSFIGSSVFNRDFRGAVGNFFSAYANSRSLVNSSSVCVNRRHFFEMGGFPEGVNVGEDMYVWLRLAMLGPMMHSSRVLSVIHRDAENRTATREYPQIPFHLRYFLNIDGVTAGDMAVKHHDLRKFLLRNALLHAAGMLLQGERALVRKLAKATLQYGIAYSAILFLMSFLPRSVLTKVRAARNSRQGIQVCI